MVTFVLVWSCLADAEIHLVKSIIWMGQTKKNTKQKYMMTC